MANQQPQNKQQSPPDPTDSMNAALFAGLPPAATATLAELWQIQLERERKRKEQEESIAAQEAEVRRQGAKAALEDLQKRQALQTMCSHRMENGNRYTGGMRTWTNEMVVTCGNCGKIWKGTRPELVKELGMLFPKETSIGGPVHGT